MFAAGFVLSQPDPRRIAGIAINGFPSEGRYVRLETDPLPYSFEIEPKMQSGYGAAFGQGTLLGIYFGGDGHNPSDNLGDLSGGFLVTSELDLSVCEQHCMITLFDHSVLPFLLSPEAKADYIARGETRAIEVLAGIEVGVDTWYPTEISARRKSVETHGHTDVALGVVRLTSPLSSGPSAGCLRFVYERGKWDPTVQEYWLFRFGRRIGQAEVVC